MAEAAGKPVGVVLFWGRQPEEDGRAGRGSLSQGWPGPFSVEGATYPTAEHWMMDGRTALAPLAGRGVAGREVRSVETWRSTLRAALKDALRAREALVVAVLRQTLAAIDNAEAAEVSAAPPVQPGVIAGGVAGLGAGEVPRRVLTAEAVTAIVEREAQELRAAASAYSAIGRQEEARAVRRQLEVLDSLR